MKPYLAILSARFRLLLQYRAAAAAGFGCQLFWGLIRMMIFQAFFENATDSMPMNIEQVVTYVWLGQAFILLIPFRMDRDLEEKIRTGHVAYELLRPVDLYCLIFSRIVAARVAPVMLRAVPMLIVATLAGWIRWPGPASIAAGTVAIGGAMLLAASLSALASISMFWTISGRGLMVVLGPLMWLLSGIMVPLPLFPESLQPLLNALPYRGLIDIPLRTIAGHIPPTGIGWVLLHQLAWTSGLVVLGRWMLSRGLRRVVVQGG